MKSHIDAMFAAHSACRDAYLASSKDYWAWETQQSCKLDARDAARDNCLSDPACVAAARAMKAEEDRRQEVFALANEVAMY